MRLRPHRRFAFQNADPARWCSFGDDPLFRHAPPSKRSEGSRLDAARCLDDLGITPGGRARRRGP